MKAVFYATTEALENAENRFIRMFLILIRKKEVSQHTTLCTHTRIIYGCSRLLCSGSQHRMLNTETFCVNSTGSQPTIKYSQLQSTLDQLDRIFNVFEEVEELETDLLDPKVNVLELHHRISALEICRDQVLEQLAGQSLKVKIILGRFSFG